MLQQRLDLLPNIPAEWHAGYPLVPNTHSPPAWQRQSPPKWLPRSRLLVWLHGYDFIKLSYELAGLGYQKGWKQQEIVEALRVAQGSVSQWLKRLRRVV
jgi:hypothetical protein